MLVYTNIDNFSLEEKRVLNNEFIYHKIFKNSEKIQISKKGEEIKVIDFINNDNRYFFNKGVKYICLNSLINI